MVYRDDRVFMKSHKNVHIIVCDSDTGQPIHEFNMNKAVYGLKGKRFIKLEGETIYI